MAAPMFHAGQLVSIMVMTPFIEAIPKAIIRDIRFSPALTPYTNPKDGKRYRTASDSHVYLIEGCDDWFRERCLRPYKDDDYTQDQSGADKFTPIYDLEKA